MGYGWDVEILVVGGVGRGCGVLVEHFHFSGRGGGITLMNDSNLISQSDRQAAGAAGYDAAMYEDDPQRALLLATRWANEYLEARKNVLVSAWFRGWLDARDE